VTNSSGKESVKGISNASKRYDEKHPVVSYRVTKEEYTRLKDVLTRQNKTMKEFFRQALKLEEREYREAQRRGYLEGFNDAKEKYAVWLYCVDCGNGIAVADEKVKEEMTASYERMAMHTNCDVPKDADPRMIIRFKKRRNGNEKE